MPQKSKKHQIQSPNSQFPQSKQSRRSPLNRPPNRIPPRTPLLHHLRQPLLAPGAIILPHRAPPQRALKTHFAVLVSARLDLSHHSPAVLLETYTAREVHGRDVLLVLLYFLEYFWAHEFAGLAFPGVGRRGGTVWCLRDGGAM